MLAIMTLEKRTSEDIFYDIDCTLILDATETISSVTTVEADTDGLTFGIPSINSQPITFPDGSIGAIGKVIIVKIAGGTIPAGLQAYKYTVRAVFVTNEGNTREASVYLNVTNVPVQAGW